jgi:hypothetical protein
MIAAVVMMVTMVAPAAIIGNPDIRAASRIIIGTIVVTGIIGIISSRSHATRQQQWNESQ